jgi:gluconokinase
VNPPAIVVMGVSGSGKSTVGAALAQALRVEFVEGDAFHPPENVARMAAGVALTDADRAGWLAALAAHIAQAAPRGVVVSCSALKRAYRDVLRAACPAPGRPKPDDAPRGQERSDWGANPVRFVWLDLPRADLELRLAGRTGHYMPPSLLTSQIATLEPPQPDEHAIRIDATRPVEAIVQETLARI